MNWRKPLVLFALKASGSKIPSILKKIKKASQLSDKDAKKHQDEKLKAILLHSYNRVPYYKKVFTESKVIVNETINLERFSKIPFLTKQIIRNEANKMYSDDYLKRKYYENTSGGSTGEPVRFIQDKQYNEWNIANKIWIKLQAGQDIGDRELRFWGSERDLLEGKESLKIRLRNWMYNRKEFNTFRMSEKDMFRYIKLWNEYKPNWVESYVQSIYEFAKFIKEKNLKIISPKNGILTSAGTLYPHMKEMIEEVFRCKVYNRYGSREVGDMACGLNELELSIWNQKIEVINGKVYVTTLNNLSMPLIRYDIGDVGEWGSNWGYLKKIEGRETSIFKTKSGKIIPGEFFIHFIGVIYNNGGIAKFQVIQKDYKLIEIKTIIRNKLKFDENKNAIEKSIKKEMTKDTKIVWNHVKSIPALKSGKYEYIRSELK